MKTITGVGQKCIQRSFARCLCVRKRLCGHGVVNGFAVRSKNFCAGQCRSTLAAASGCRQIRSRGVCLFKCFWLASYRVPPSACKESCADSASNKAGEIARIVRNGTPCFGLREYDHCGDSKQEVRGSRPAPPSGRNGPRAATSALQEVQRSVVRLAEGEADLVLLACLVCFACCALLGFALPCLACSACSALVGLPLCRHSPCMR